MSEIPQFINNQLTVNSSTNVTVSLQLDQPAIINADATSAYGKDARAATLNLPQQFNFHFSGTAGTTIDEVSNAEWNLFGESATFIWNAQAATSFDNLIKEILIPFTCSQTEFSVENNLSAFNILSGKAAIQWSAWALPVAQIDINNPTTAEGIGAITIRCDKGISSEWAGMQNGAANLSNPYIPIKRWKNFCY